MTETTYRHTEKMGEISGFGGEYETACQDMLEVGVEWIVNNPDLKDKLKGVTYENIYGIFTPESEETKALEKVILNAVDDCTGAMHQAVMTRLMYIAANGWDSYVEELEKTPEEE